MGENRIERSVDIAASVSRVWEALADHRQFGEWFGVKLEGPFTVGKPVRGKITYPGYEHVTFEVVVTALEKPRRLAWTWHPYAIDPAVDYSGEKPTTVEFVLAEVGTGTRVTVVETGFDHLPRHRRPDALRMNTSGWEEQMRNIADYVAAH